jgi:hypothetical protein
LGVKSLLFYFQSIIIYIYIYIEREREREMDKISKDMENFFTPSNELMLQSPNLKLLAGSLVWSVNPHVQVLGT